MKELDFIHFGINPDNQELLDGICAALLDLHSWRDALHHSQNEKEPALLENRNDPITSSLQLIECYARMWRNRQRTRIFFTGAYVEGSLKQAIRIRAEIEKLVPDSVPCSVALEIINEYEVYSRQWIETRQHMKAQRSVQYSRYQQFFQEAVSRHGEKCANCESVDNLKLDHIKAVSHGGFSVVENFQLLCFSCNSKKGKHERAAIHG